MAGHRARVLLVISCVVAVCPVPAAIAQQFHTTEPPAEIETRLQKLLKRDDRAASTFALADRDEAAPYLRRELRETTDKFNKQDLSEALGAVQKRVFERNKKRLVWWNCAVA